MPLVRKLQESMNITLAGGLVGTAVAVLLFAVEYSMLHAGAAARAKGKRRKPALDGAERKRIGSVARFCLFLPPVFAALFWLVWG